MANSPWSPITPKLQLAWDATSLASLMTCARRYEYEMIEGYRGSNVDFEFGGFFASAVERYKKARVQGLSKSEAQLLSTKWLTEATWLQPSDEETLSRSEYAGYQWPEADKEQQRHDYVFAGTPWGGSYQTQWRCTGTEKYKNAKGNAAKCPYSHKGAWFPPEAPPLCGECGSPTETHTHYVPNDSVKNRYTLIRLLVWYIEEQPENLRDGLAPLTLPDGSAAVELSVKLPLPFKSQDGEPFLLTGHLDDLSSLATENFIADNKTTTKALNERFWKGYSPSVQMDTYDLLGSTLFKDLDIRGVIVDAAQVLVSGAKFGRHILHRTDAQREEWLHDIGWWLDQAERYAHDDYWPMNKASCWNCPFNGVCSKDPSRRHAILEADFEKRKWNPLEER